MLVGHRICNIHLSSATSVLILVIWRAVACQSSPSLLCLVLSLKLPLGLPLRVPQHAEVRELRH